MKKLIILLTLLLIPLTLSLEVKEEIYSSLTTHPSFFCPHDAVRCELYKTINGRNQEIDPLLVQSCESSTLCNYINNIGASLGFRLLPGDICLSAASFKGYRIVNSDEPTTTTPTTTTQTTTTTTFPVQKKVCIQTFRGMCIRWDYIQPTPSCLSKGSYCLSDSECCSNKCLLTKSCRNPSIHGFCLFERVTGKCE